MGNKLSGKLGQSRGEWRDGDTRSEGSEAAVNQRKSSIWRLFRRKPSSVFLDYEGMSFDNYLQEKGSSLRGHSHSLRSSLAAPHSKAGRSPSLCEPIQNTMEGVEGGTSNMYESLERVRGLVYSTERQVSHPEEEATELLPDYCCIAEHSYPEGGEESEETYRPGPPPPWGKAEGEPSTPRSRHWSSGRRRVRLGGSQKKKDTHGDTLHHESAATVGCDDIHPTQPSAHLSLHLDTVQLAEGSAKTVLPKNWQFYMSWQQQKVVL